MKRSLLISFALVPISLAFGQGAIKFNNLQPGVPLDAPVYLLDGVTKISGSQYLAELLGGPSANSLSHVATTGFLTGNGAGYFDGGTVIINSVPPGNTAWVQVDVWNTASGASFDQAKATGLANSWWQSSVFTVIPGGQIVNPLPPAPLLGLGDSPVYLNGVPEPSCFALTGLGVVFVLCRRRWFNKRDGHLTSSAHPISISGT